MQILLAWRSLKGGASIDSDTVSQRLQKHFGGLVSQPFAAHQREAADVSLVYLEQPVQGWSASYIQQDSASFCISLDYPINAADVLASRGIRVESTNTLPTLCRELESDAASVLKELAPPFSLFWHRAADDTLWVQMDGLGFYQLFEYKDDNIYILTNRLSALSVLGVVPNPVADEWATRVGLGWFPGASCGYVNVRRLEPGESITISKSGVKSTCHDAISDWVRQEPRSLEQAGDLATDGLQRHMRNASQLMPQPTAGLTGGWDSRVIVGLLHSMGCPFQARVRGKPQSPDVLAARNLAQIAGIDLDIEKSGSMPPATTRGLRQSVSNAFLWQAGHLGEENLALFDRNRRPPRVNIMGQHGEIARAYYFAKCKSLQSKAVFSFAEAERALIEDVITPRLVQLKPRYQEVALEAVRQAFRQARRFDLDGEQALDFFYLYERTRRWASGGQYAQVNQVVTPFLAPDFIKAAYSLPRGVKQTNGLHAEIIKRVLPQWQQAPFADDFLFNAGSGQSRPLQSVFGLADRMISVVPYVGWARAYGLEDYRPWRYWKTVGCSLLTESCGSSLVREILSPAALGEEGIPPADILALLWGPSHVMV